MLPLYSCLSGDKAKIIKILGNDNIKKHLVELGFVDGSILSVITSHKGDVIVSLKDSKIAITKELSEKIMIEFV